jgi:hypothetical protein
MHVSVYARSAALAICVLLSATLSLVACSGDSEAATDGGTDAAPDSGGQGGACATAEECDDGDPCTTDRCDAEMGCLNELIDGDGDGFAEGVCTTVTLRGGDCNDMNETVYPGAPELCDELDNDCDDAVDDETVEVVCARDEDMDGFGLLSDVVRACNCPAGYIPPRSDGKFDCVDQNGAINPGHTNYETQGYCLVQLCAPSQLGYDYDCNGSVELQYPSISDGSCRFEGTPLAVCRGSGWDQNNVAICGDSGRYRICSASNACTEMIDPSRRQGCR